jgi:hypothetical protein
MNHLVLTVEPGWVRYRMNERQGSHPLGDDSAAWVIAYLLKTIPHESHEVLAGLKIP